VTTLRVEREGEGRTLGAGDFPVPIGGPGAPVPVAGSGGPLAWLGLADGEVFVQPVPGAVVRCNNVRLAASHWLRDGDVLGVGSTRVAVSVGEGGVRLAVEETDDANPTEPPVVLVPPPRGAGEGAGDDAGAAITPVEYVPRPLGPPAPRRRGPGGRTVALLGLLALAAAAVVLVSRVGSLRVQIEPTPDALALRGSWPALSVAERFFALSGPYRLSAEKPGYHPLEATVEVAAGTGRTVRRELRPLPGRLGVDTGGVAGAEVWVDGVARGRTPAPAFEVEPGEREVLVRAEGYLPWTTRVAVEGRGALQRLEVALVPLPPPPPAPARPPAPAVLALASDPPGARVSVDGEARGETPVELRLPPGRAHAVRLAKDGHDDGQLEVALRAGERREETVRLVPQLGEVRVSARPPDAELVVDGEPRGRADQTLRLVAVPHEIEIRREGYEPVTRRVTPRPGFPQVVDVALRSLRQVKEERAPPVLRSPEGHELRRVEGGRFRLGASRREPGRRANEPLRDVELVRPFYLATREVTNAQLRRFAAGHSSGRIGGHGLDLDEQPAVNVTWQQAAAYCNWLSDRETLPRAYVEREGKLVPAVPPGPGYRLPTEAEWERAARYPDGRTASKYPWGPALPVPPRAGNYADARARSLVAQVLDGYDDGHAATAPVGSFPPSPLGFHDLGSNVAEWTHDFYSITPSVEGQLVRDPVGPGEGEYHVIRGASFMHATVTELRLSFRDFGKEARPDVGFRVARYAE
jgi:formylglycine-generating enzyme required for sulfatase activity